MVVQVDCSAIDPTGLEEKLFGREGGAPGLFREADGGTLVLEEVDRLPPGAQARLLHAIQRREVLALDAAQPIAVDVRILAVAGPALREAVDAAYFCAESGDVVTLSPACAAFDCYANFMERGRAYKEMVKKLGE